MKSRDTSAAGAMDFRLVEPITSVLGSRSGRIRVMVAAPNASEEPSAEPASDDSASSGSDGDIDWLLRAAARAPSRALDGGLSVGMHLLGDRFVIEGKLGQGGMGAVYIARDRERSGLVALKTLLRRDADAVYRIKQEFRSLADVLHPNLVRLYELFEDDGRWFFTMELVKGAPLLDALNHRELPERFSQLSAGIGAIHAAGKLHRDLKPSNVLLTPEGRVVILDFGLSADATLGGVGQTIGDSVSGTPDYMAPEQAAGCPAQEACDWYAFGVMLYQALCGKLPFSGRTGEVLAAKQLGAPPPPSHHDPAIDPALDELCRRLLVRDPETRAGAAEVSAVLPSHRHSEAHTLRPPTLPPAAQESELTFVGRAKELRELAQAYDDVQPGRPVVALLPGSSGFGKSKLMAHFCASVTAPPGSALVLSGRCYERESVPFKAFDGVIDALSRHLRQLDLHAAAALMPRDVQLLARLFPVLSRVTCVQASPRRDHGIADPQELRARALLALAELLGRIADRQRLVITLDDLQWMDLDSTRLLLGVLHAPEAPGVLLLASYRREEAESNPALSALLRGLQEMSIAVRTIEVGPLPEPDVQALLHASGAGLVDGQSVDELAREAQGSPFFATRLAQYRPSNAGRALTLDAVLRAQIDDQTSDGQALLRAASLSPCPVPLSLLQAVTGVASARDTLSELRQQHLLRAIEGGGDARVVPYHDRIRECLVTTTSAEARRSLHEQLALAWQERPDAEPDTLVTHWLEAGSVVQAGPAALRAARKARDGMAFDRAAARFRQALELLEPEGAERRELLIELADALAAAGNGPQAGEAYLKAAEASAHEARAKLRWQATMQVLFSRNAPDATELLLDTLPALGVPVPSAWWRMVRFGAAVVRFRLQPPERLQLKPEAERDPELLRRFDYTAAAGEGLWGGPRGYLFMYFWGETARLGKQTGEPGRGVHAACLAEIARMFMFGWHDARIGERLAQYRRQLQACTEPTVSAHALYLIANAELVSGALAAAARDFEQARRELSVLPGAHAHLALTASMMQYFTTWHLGDFDTVRRIGRDVEAGDARGNRIVLKKGRFARLRLALVDDDVPAARQHLERSNDVMAWDEPGLFEVEQLEIAVLIELYAGAPEVALKLVEQGEAVHRQNMWWPQLLVGYAHAALDTAARDPQRARGLLHKAARLARQVQARSPRAQVPMAIAIHAAIAFQRGDTQAALELLQEAETEFSGLGMLAYRDMVRRQRGLLLDGSAGEALVAEADAALRARGVVNPERFTHAHVPGFQHAAKQLPARK
jgi:serine/threonine protein kinase/tetratricopeptide (TPR) repeat protein